ncbi:MAG: N-acetylmuramoyl-L-alanine amidase [Armatimonadetes bacterium]|nr:N-acetylmuramoyl-L-alanine amidase [Armatimonadota bacterium]
MGVKRLALLLVLVFCTWVLHERSSHRRHGPRGIVIHHTASPGKLHGELVSASMIDEWHTRRGFHKEYNGKVYHIGYHYVIRIDGVIERGRPEGCRGAHATKGNDCLGICLVGNFTRRARGLTFPSRPTPQQMAALHHLLEVLVDRYRFRSAQIHTHREVDGDTACPGDRFPIAQVRKWVKDLDGNRRLASIFGRSSRH